MSGMFASAGLFRGEEGKLLIVGTSVRILDSGADYTKAYRIFCLLYSYNPRLDSGSFGDRFSAAFYL